MRGKSTGQYANAVTNDAFRKIFGLRNAYSGWNITDRLYVYRHCVLNEDDFFRFFKIRGSHFSYLDMFRDNDFMQLFHKELHYCPKCMKLGYHSYLHQLTFVYVCPFHREPLLCLVCEGRTVSYSIVSTLSEAYSVMHAREKLPAERYVEIMSSNKLIDGIWQDVPDFLWIQCLTYDKILFFNPLVGISGSISTVSDSTLGILNCLCGNSSGIKPSIIMDKKYCRSKYNELLEECREWFTSRYHVFHKNSLEYWFIAMLIDKLICDMDEKVLMYAIYNMQRKELYYEIDSRAYLEASSAVITSYIATNARKLIEGIDKSIVYHHSLHNIIRRCTFSIFKINSCINTKSMTDEYIPFFIFQRLFNKLYEHIYLELQVDISLSFNYNKLIEIDVPDYVVLLKNDCYEIYEIMDGLNVTAPNDS